MRDPLPRRKRLRSASWDYRTPGAYFVTICTWRRRAIFGRIARGEVRLSEFGLIVDAAWRAIPAHCPGVAIDAFVVMPDHVHGVLVLMQSTQTLGQVVNLFKGAASRGINRLRGTPGAPVWQRSFHDWIIRDDAAWAGIARYIADNPRRASV